MTTTTKTADAGKHENLAAALAAFQAELPTIAKGKTGDAGTYRYQYAGIDDIHPVAMPLLGKHGMAFSSQPTMIGEAFVLHYSLMHEGGDTIEGIYPLPEPTTSKPQAIGSAITYARRYAFCAVTGIAPGGDDDDAAAANEKPAAGRKPRASKPTAPQQPPTPAPFAEGLYAQDILDANSVDELRKVADRVEGAAELGLKFSRDEREQSYLVEVAKHFKLSLPGAPSDAPIGWLLTAVKKSIEARPMESKAAQREAELGIAGAEVSLGEPDGPHWETAQIPEGEPES